MSETLRECPFCGGEASKRLFYGSRYGVYCDQCSSRVGGLFLTESEAIQAWNIRAERTCRNLDKHHNIMFKCSECGHWECQDFDGEKILPQTWNYCPNCGRRVVNNDN